MNKKEQQYEELIKSFDKGYELCMEYDSIPHYYGDEVLYQSEMHFLQEVGNTPNITITVIAKQIGKTQSACSQMVRKLIKKHLITQERNPDNNREYYLNLTAKGFAIYYAHEEFDRKCLQRIHESLKDFSAAELQSYISIQKTLNEVFTKDVTEHNASLSINKTN